MDFKQESHRIYIEDNGGKVIAEVTFPESKPGIYNIDYTFVDESLRGQGVASQLVERAVAAIESRGGQVVATCSYASVWLERHKNRN